MKKSTKVMAVCILALVVVIMKMGFIEGYMYLINDDEIMNTLSEGDVLIEYPYIELEKRIVKSRIEAMDGKTFSETRQEATPSSSGRSRPGNTRETKPHQRRTGR